MAELMRYPFDPTGKNPNNLVSSEKHELTVNARQTLRVFVLDHGCFYTDGLTVRDAKGARLAPNNDYVASYLYEDATKYTGRQVCGAIVVTNPNVSDVVYVDAQMVGGSYALSTDALEQVLETLANDQRPVEWANIIGKPTAYPPSGHLHAIWELYGFEPVVEELERIVQAIYVGDQAAFDDVRDYVRRLHDESIAYTDSVDESLQRHIGDKGNPHETTKAQVELGDVSNYPDATDQEAYDGIADNRFMTPRASTIRVVRHEESRNHPEATTNALGFVTYSTSINTALGKDSVGAVVPSGLKAALTRNSGAMGTLWPQIELRIKELAAIPLVGMIADFSATTAPPNWLKLDGHLYNRSDYPLLWQWIQRNAAVVSEGAWSSRRGCFTAGNGSTTFRVPDYADRYRRSYSSGLTLGGWLDQDFQKHKHSGYTHPNGAWTPTGRTSAGGNHTHRFGLIRARDDKSGTPDTLGWGNFRGHNRYNNNVFNDDVNNGGIGYSGNHSHTMVMDPIPAHQHGFDTDEQGGSETRPKTVVALPCVYAGPDI